MTVMEAPIQTDSSAGAPANNRNKLLALLLVGVVLLAAAAYFVPKLLKGDETPTSTSSSQVGSKRSTAKKAAADKAVGSASGATAKTAPAKKPLAKKLPAKKAAPLKFKDPFAPLYVEPVVNREAAGAAGAPTSPIAAAATGVSVTAPTVQTTTPTGTNTGTTSAGTGAGTTTTSGGATPVTTTKVSLAAVGTRDSKLRASVTVGTTLYTPAVGDIFGKVYKLVSVEGSCGTFLFGDQKFGLCVGQYIVH